MDLLEVELLLDFFVALGVEAWVELGDFAGVADVLVGVGDERGVGRFEGDAVVLHQRNNHRDLVDRSCPSKEKIEKKN